MSHRTHRATRATEFEIIATRWSDDDQAVYMSLDPHSSVGDFGVAPDDRRTSTQLDIRVPAGECGDQ
jgi:hypothetical protein